MSELQYKSEFTVVDALPPGYSKWPAGAPQRDTISFTIDGQEIQAPEGTMLVDAAKFGGIEIPVFCYEPKLGAPVGACRMCLVEIEGIPKLQTACSTPVRDGMAVITKSDRVVEAQNAVVEFLLVNHPLDCPVCDKGGECPLQDISYGWGLGESRVSEPKRHFDKPIALSPGIAIDNERCIMCYRCVRFSQEVSEDYQLVLLERGADTYVGTFDGEQYIAPFSGNIIELCPVGALTSRAYRFRARPWDVVQGGSVCSMCPAQCNVSYTVRDDKVMRVLARDNNAVDDGWLCDRGRFAYQAWESDARITEPMVRQGGVLKPARWDHALDVAAAALKKAGASAAALAGGATTNEEAWLLRRLMGEALGSQNIDSRRSGRLDPEVARALADPDATISVPDLDWADVVLLLGSEPVDEMPILDLRLRKGINRNNVKLAVASARPGALDPKAELSCRFAPRRIDAFVQALLAALEGADPGTLVEQAGADAEQVSELAELLRGAERPVVVWSEKTTHYAGSDVAASVASLLERLAVRETDGAGHLQIPTDTNGRGLAEVGFLPNIGPGLAGARDGRSAEQIREALGEEISTLLLIGADPAADFPAREQWEAALARTNTVITFASWLDGTAERHADVIFPLEVGAEKEGTLTHPDGRIQRLRQNVERAGSVKAGWWVVSELAKRLGLDFGLQIVHQATAELAAGVPIYAGVTPDEIGGTGVRWQEREAASSLPAPAERSFQLTPPSELPQDPSKLRLGTFRSIWSSGDVANAETLQQMVARTRIELSPEDGASLGVESGQEITLATDSGEITALVALRDVVPVGSAFLLDSDDEELRTALAGSPSFVGVRR